MGVRISKRLLISGAGLAGFILLIMVFAPRFRWNRATIPTIETAKFHQPSLQPALHTVSSPLTKLSPLKEETKTRTPCQPCIQAAQEVLARYLAAIRTGAGPDDRQQQTNVLETNRIYSPNSPMYAGSVLGNDQLHAQYQRQLDASRALPSPASGSP